MTFAYRLVSPSLPLVPGLDLERWLRQVHFPRHARLVRAPCNPTRRAAIWALAQGAQQAERRARGARGWAELPRRPAMRDRSVARWTHSNRSKSCGNAPTWGRHHTLENAELFVDHKAGDLEKKTSHA
jgi:hypothetical protein